MLSVDTYLDKEALVINDDEFVVRDHSVGVGTSNLSATFNVDGDVLIRGDFKFGGISQMTPFFLEGLEYNKSGDSVTPIQNGRIILGGNLIADVDDSGLTLAIINKADHSVVSVTSYDTNVDNANATSFVNAVDAMTVDQIGFLVSWDVYEPPNADATNWRSVLERVGLHQLLMSQGRDSARDPGSDRHSYAAVFEVAESSHTAKVVEICQFGDHAQRPSAKIGGFLMGGTFYAGNGQSTVVLSPQGHRIGMIGASDTSGDPFLSVGRNFVEPGRRLSVDQHMLVGEEFRFSQINTYDLLTMTRGANDFVFFMADDATDEIVFGANDFSTKRFRLQANGDAFSDGWNTGGADYAEWFLFEERTQPGDVVGINPNTGRTRRYQEGDIFLGIHSTEPGLIGNSPASIENRSESYALVGLSGQIVVDFLQVLVKNRQVFTRDGYFIGLLLANDKVFIR